MLEQRIWMAQGINATYVSFRLVRATRPVALEIRPLCTFRDYHAHRRGFSETTVLRCADGLQVKFPSSPACWIKMEGAEIDVAPDWYWNFKHREEEARGLDGIEDLLCPGILKISLAAGENRVLVLSVDPHAPTSEVAQQAELDRQQKLTSADLGRVADEWSVFGTRLRLAADQFIVDRRRPETPGGKSVIAGYPWFADWGRDTMIALPGLALTTERFEIADQILRTFAGFLSQGMLPNRFPDSGERPEYNTADATLWFFLAVEQYVRLSGDIRLRRDLYPALKESIAWHVRGTRYGIGMDPKDGLLRAGEPGVQLTWMDAKVGDWVVTPRIGKCVEINALWFNALQAMKEFAAQERDSEASARFTALTETVVENFGQRFWNVRNCCLYDVVDGPEGDLDEFGRRADASMRPNQIFAVSLEHGLLGAVRARAVVDACARRLWTPVGLRSLAADDPRFAPRYCGGPSERDGAYHQGTVWSWLLGPFTLAHFRAYGDLAIARSYLAGLNGHLREGCVGQVSEIFDGMPPFAPRGCFAQAWGVAEALRAWRILDER